MLTSKLIAPWAHPSGMLGRLAGWEMARGRGPAGTARSSTARPAADCILEIGCGPASRSPTSHRVVARPCPHFDLLQATLDQASRRNAAAIAEGRVELRRAPAERLPHGDDAFDRVVTLNSIAHRLSPAPVSAEVAGALARRGRARRPVSSWDALDTVMADLSGSGFSVERVVDGVTLVVARPGGEVIDSTRRAAWRWAKRWRAGSDVLSSQLRPSTVGFNRLADYDHTLPVLIVFNHRYLTPVGGGYCRDPPHRMLLLRPPPSTRHASPQVLIIPPHQSHQCRS